MFSLLTTKKTKVKFSANLLDTVKYILWFNIKFDYFFLVNFHFSNFLKIGIL